MKYKISIFFITISTLMCAQVGINTKDVKGRFHIDGKADNNNTAISTAVKESNDFIISEDGNISIGTPLDNFKLNIETGGTATIPIAGLRIDDGSALAQGKVLTSDAQGNASWQLGQGGSGTIYRTNTRQAFNGNYLPLILLNANGLPFTKIPIPKTGNYAFMIRWWGSATTNNNNNDINSTVAIGLSINNVTPIINLTTVVQYTLPTAAGNFSFNILINKYLNQGDLVEIIVAPYPLTVTWNIGTLGSTLFAPSVVMALF